MNDLDIKRAKLDAIFQSYKGEVALTFACYDENSFLLVYAQRLLGPRLFALEVDAEIFTKEDRRLCQVIVRNMGIQLFTVTALVMPEPDFVRNDEKRCFYCRRHVLGTMAKGARRMGAQNVIVGLTIDAMDRQLYVADALKELDVAAPLAEAGLTSADIDALALKTNITLPEGGRCMAVRIPPGMPLDAETLQFLGDAEALLRSYGLQGARVEIINDRKARIVWPRNRIEFEDDIKYEIKAFMGARHFEIINLDE